MKPISPLFTAYQDAACRLWRATESLGDPDLTDREIKAALKKVNAAYHLLEVSYELAQGE